MFVLSHLQFSKLIGRNEYWQAENLLDLGAGDGEVTKNIAGFFKNVYVTEVSTTMQYLLEKKGYKYAKNKKFIAIFTFNIIH